jgi:hypothetical protein
MDFFADVSKGLDDIMALGDVIICGKFVILVEDGGGHAHEGLFRPGEEPVDGAAVDQAWEFPASDPQSIANGAHRQYDVQSLPDSLNKSAVNRLWRFWPFQFGVEGSGGVDEIFSFFQLPQIGDLSRVKQIVNVLKEKFLHDLVVSEEESDGLVLI